jgi:hypothetical protein
MLSMVHVFLVLALNTATDWLLAQVLRHSHDGFYGKVPAVFRGFQSPL